MRHAPYPMTQRAPILTSPTSVAFGAMTAEGLTLGLWLPLFSSIGTPLAHFVSPLGTPLALPEARNVVERHKETLAYPCLRMLMSLPSGSSHRNGARPRGSFVGPYSITSPVSRTRRSTSSR